MGFSRYGLWTVTVTLLASLAVGVVILTTVTAQEGTVTEQETDQLKARLEADYQKAVELFDAGKYGEARQAFHAIARQTVETHLVLSDETEQGLRYYIGSAGQPGAVDEAIAKQKAKPEKKVVALPPELTPAQKLLQTVEEERRVMLERARREADLKLEQAAQDAANQKFDESIEKLQALLARVEASDWPPEMKSFYRNQTELKLSKARADKRQYELTEALKSKREAKHISEEEARAREQESSMRREARMKQAELLSQAGRHDEALQILEALLEENRADLDVMRLHEAIERKRIRIDMDYIERILRHETRKALWQTAEEAVPYVLPLMRYPRDWAELTKMREKLFAPSEVAVSPVDQAVYNKLGNTVSVDFVDTPLSEVMQFLETFGGFNIVIDQAGVARVAVAGEPLVTLKLSSVTIDTALKFITEPLGLCYGVRDGVLVISDTQGVQGTRYMQMYDIRDLLGAVPDYTPPSLDIETSSGGGGESGGGGYRGGGGGGGGGDFFEGEEGEEEFVPATQTGTEISDLIQRAVEADSWADPQNTIEFRAPGSLIVIQTPEVHEKIRKLLEGLRQMSAMQVSIDLRVVSLHDTYTQLVGTDWSVSLASSVGDDWIYSIGISGYNTGATGISGAGGIGVTGSFMNDMMVNLFLTAIQENRMGHVLQAPRLTCLNGQRANISVTTEIAYVSDVDIEREVLGDPPVVVMTQDITTETISEGIVFDVRPVISSDRRYVQLELRPNIATVKRPITQFATGYSEAGVPTGFVQLPERENVRIRTNVNVPDKGTLLIGGLNYSSEGQGEATVPVLGKLPLIKRLFSAAGQSRARTNLIMLVRPEIIIQEEQERARR